MTKEMETGMEFSSFSSKTKISKTYTTTLTQSTTQTFTQSAEQTITVGCGGETDGQNFGIFQWVTESSDAVARAYTALTICRHGDGLWNLPPSCPYTACIDSMCTQCAVDWAE